MAVLGLGVYATPYGTGAQTITMDRATVVGDEFFAFGLSDATSGSNPTWTPPNPPFTHGLDFTAVRAASHDGLFGTWQFLAHGAPGVQSSGKVYTFTHASLAMQTILMLCRCNEQVLSDGIGGGAASFHGDFPATSPAGPLAVNFPLANPGFDFLMFNHNGGTALGPSGDPPSMTPVGFLRKGGGDNIDASLYIQRTSRNVAFVGNLSVPWAQTLIDGWTIITATAQLGATNTPSTLQFPGGVPLGGRGGGGFAPGGLYRQTTFQNPGQFGMGPRTGRHFG